MKSTTSNQSDSTLSNIVDTTVFKIESKTYQNQSEVELWKLFRSGDEGAFIAIYQTYIDILYNFGIQHCKDEELVKDCLQDFFIYLREKRSGLAEATSIKFYLMKSFRRKLLDYLKKYRKRLAVRLKYQQENLFKFEISEETKIINRQFNSMQVEALNKAINKLTSKEREAIYLYFFSNFSYKEISEIQGYTHISSARRLIYKALDQLRITLKLAVFFICYLFLS